MALAGCRSLDRIQQHGQCRRDRVAHQSTPVAFLAETRGPDLASAARRRLRNGARQSIGLKTLPLSADPIFQVHPHLGVVRGDTGEKSHWTAANDFAAGQHSWLRCARQEIRAGRLHFKHQPRRRTPDRTRAPTKDWQQCRPLLSSGARLLSGGLDSPGQRRTFLGSRTEMP